MKNTSEQIGIQFLETSTSDARVEVDALMERVDLDVGLSRRRECSLGTLASRSQTTLVIIIR